MNIAFGEPLGGGEARHIALSPTDRLRSIYTIGSSGSGKSSAIETWAYQLVVEDEGFALIDVEDKLAPRVLSHLQDAGRTPVIIDPTHHITPLNLLALHGQEPHQVVEAVLQTFERYWWASWGPRFEDIVRHTLLLLIEHNLTLGELPAVLSNRVSNDTQSCALTRHPVLRTLSPVNSASDNDFGVDLPSPATPIVAQWLSCPGG